MSSYSIFNEEFKALLYSPPCLNDTHLKRIKNSEVMTQPVKNFHAKRFCTSKGDLTPTQQATFDMQYATSDTAVH